MKTINNPKRKVSVTNQRSYFDWTDEMQVVCKGHRLKTIMKSSNLHPEERVADEEKVVINGPLKGYAPLYPLSIIIALSFQLDNTEAHLFRKYICQKLQKPASIITPIFLIDNMDN